MRAFGCESLCLLPGDLVIADALGCACIRPFALGPRQCPARNFALYELRTLIAMLLLKWTWTLPEDSPHLDTPRNGFSPFALSLPKNLEIDFKRI